MCTENTGIRGGLGVRESHLAVVLLMWPSESSVLISC